MPEKINEAGTEFVTVISVWSQQLPRGLLRSRCSISACKIKRKRFSFYSWPLKSHLSLNTLDYWLHKLSLCYGSLLPTEFIVLYELVMGLLLQITLIPTYIELIIPLKSYFVTARDFHIHYLILTRIIVVLNIV